MPDKISLTGDRRGARLFLTWKQVATAYRQQMAALLTRRYWAALSDRGGRASMAALYREMSRLCMAAAHEVEEADEQPTAAGNSQGEEREA